MIEVQLVAKEAMASPADEVAPDHKEKLDLLVYEALMASQENEDVLEIQDVDDHQVTSLWSTVRP